MNKIPRQYSWVKFDYNNLPIDYLHDYPFKKEDVYIFFGEIPNMPGHCIICDEMGKFHIGYHTDHFYELSQEET